MPPRIASFVLPLGYSFNLDGSMMYMTFATIFIAQAYGIDLTLGQEITMLLMLMITSKGIAGVPRASLVVIAATLPQFNIPEAGLLLDPRRRPFPRHGPLGDQRRRQCGGERGRGALGGPARSARAGRDRAAARAPSHHARRRTRADAVQRMLEIAGIELLPAWPVFLASSLAGLALNIVPGADMTFIIASAARGGRRDGVVASLGVGAGALVHIFAAVLGLSAILASSQAAFDAIK